MKRILILGGGASGLAAAITAAQCDPAAQVTVVEKLDRVGKKILATGNGRCNLTNEHLSPACYHTSQQALLEAHLAKMPTRRALEFFQNLGLYCTTEELGRVYPNARQASAVVDVLLLALDRLGIRVVCGAEATSLRRDKRGWLLETARGDRYSADAVILSAGGCAAPKQGTDGSGLALARQLGHRCTKPYPCLVPVKCDAPLLRGLKGVRAHGSVTLWEEGAVLAQEAGEIQFTDYGLSGIPVFQLTCRMLPGKAQRTLAVDLLPEWELSALTEWLLREAAAHPEETLERFAPGLIHKKLMYAALKEVGASPLSLPLSRLSPKQCRRLAQVLKQWRFPVTDALGFDAAQVTGGGVLLSEVDDHFASRRQPGLYLTGELLDVVGECGGYNLHWAWCSGILAGSAAVGCNEQA